ncbi:metal-dependent protein hydrolase [Cladochytrium replicatum]|nr:metal-dependent protein hydrolase [Cladochytrium replicatum]
MPTVATHNGTFHADECLAVYLLTTHVSPFRGSSIVRSRDPKVLEKADIVVDVGGEYDPSRHRYDHHQRGFVETFSPEHDIKLSSAGLVYKHFGKEVIADILGWEHADPRLETVWLKAYDDLVKTYDGVDNGVQQYPGDVKPRYRDRTTIGARVGNLNPWWNDTTTNVDDRFKQAVSMTGAEFVDFILYLGKSWLPAREIVANAVSARFEADASGKIILFRQYSPWKEHYHILEAELRLNESGELPLYVVYPDETAGQWRVQAIPKAVDSFESRKALPEPWRGVRDDDLSQLSGIPGCVFVHASGFIGGNKTLEGALTMAKKAVVF